jgi:hypothetical protein
MTRQRSAGYEEARSLGLLVPDASVTLATSAAADDIVDTATAHGFVAGDSVVFDTLTGGTGLSIDTRYWVIAANLAAQTFQIALTAGGAAIDFTTDITAGTVRKDGPDVRVALAMSGFTATAAAVHLDDITIDEFDGSGYARYDATGVAVAYDSGSDEWRITCDNGAGDEFGILVGAGTLPPSMLVVILHVDGTAPNDYVLGWSDEGSLDDGNGGTLGLTLPVDVIFSSGNA